MDQIIIKELKSKHPELDESLIKKIYFSIIEIQNELKRASP